jgi:hypothetical protein
MKRLIGAKLPPNETLQLSVASCEVIVVVWLEDASAAGAHVPWGWTADRPQLNLGVRPVLSRT